MADTEKLAKDLRLLKDELALSSMFEIVPEIDAAIEFIERTPKPITARDACKVFNDLNYRKRTWATSGGDVYTLEHQCDDHEHLQFTRAEAVWIAQGLLRDRDSS